MSKYNFEVNVVKKSNLSHQDIILADALIEEWKNKTNMLQKNETTFFKEKTDNNDLALAGTFAHKLSLYPFLFESIQVKNYGENSRPTRYL